MNTIEEAMVRRARPDDAPALARLRLAFRSESRAVTESVDAFLARCEAWMHPRLGHDSPWRTWVIERDGGLLGNIWLQVIEKIPNPGDESERHAYISNFYVHPSARNGGVGSALLAAALAEADALEVDTVFLWPSARSRPLYERHGFSSNTRVLAFERR
jgi:GNAT superfamily N-acetyltransferase